LDGKRVSVPNRLKVLPLIPFFFTSLSTSGRSSTAAEVTFSALFLSSSKLGFLCLGAGALATKG
jgi:hypothetical protein